MQRITSSGGRGGKKTLTRVHIFVYWEGSHCAKFGEPRLEALSTFNRLARAFYKSSSIFDCLHFRKLLTRYCIAPMFPIGMSARARISTLGHHVILRFVWGGWFIPEMEDCWFWLLSPQSPLPLRRPLWVFTTRLSDSPSCILVLHQRE